MANKEQKLKNYGTSCWIRIYARVAVVSNVLRYTPSFFGVG
jgi:hypothetical protein